MKIRTRILLNTATVVLVTSATLILVVYFFMLNSMQRQEIKDLHQHVDQAAENITEHLQLPALQLRTLAKKELANKDDDSLSEELTEFNNVVIEFYSTSYTNLKGKIMASSDRSLIGQNILRVVPNIQDEFQEALHGKNGEVIISNIQMCPKDVTYNTDSVDMQMLVGVYSREGKLKGILTALYDVGYLAHHVKDISASISGAGASFLVDKSGRVLISSDSSVGFMEPIRGLTVAELKKEFSTKSNGYTIYTDQKGHKKLSGFVNLSSIGNSHEHPWALFVEVPYSSFLTPIHKLLFRLFYILIIFLVLILILALMFSHNLTRPLKWLIQATENLGDGQYERLEYNSKSEVGDLVSAYNSAVNKIKNTTQDLIENEELFRNLAESTSAGIAIIKNSKIVYINKATTEIFGYGPEEFVGMDFWHLVHPDFRETVKNYGLSRQKGEAVPQHYEFRATSKSGEDRWISLSAASLIWKGEMAGVATLIDFTEKKQAEEKLRFDEQRLRLAQHIGRLGFLDWNLKTSKVEVAAEGLEIMGLPPEKTVFDFDELVKLIHPDDVQMVMRGLAEARAGNARLNIQHRLFTANGSERYVWSTGELIRDENGKPVRLLGTIQDITESKEKEASLKLFRSLIDGTYDAIEVADPETGRFVDVNEWGCKVLGYSREEFLKLSVPDIDPNVDSDRFKKIMAALRKVGLNTMESYHRRRDGSTFPVELSVRLIKLDKEYVVTVARDITERKLNEQKLIEAKEKAEESERLKSAFLANMSHEIRTPMNGILGFASLLKEPLLTKEEQKKYLSIIEKSGERMLNTVNDIIDISKIESGQMAVTFSDTNVNEQMKFVYNFFKPEVKQKGLDIVLNTGLPEDKSIISTDKEKFFGIMTNLIKNAVKFTQEGSIELGYAQKDGFLEFYVKDTGTGIPQDQFELVFRRFIQGSTSLTRNYEGSGLGLTISKAYVEMLGGKIWLESHADKADEKVQETGTTFFFTLPYNNRAYAKTRAPLPVGETEKPSKKLKIMIVEDDDISEQLLGNIIKPYTDDIIVCHGGREAVERARKHPDVDLIFMDVKMPDMDGLEATREIREFNEKVVIIAQTAFAQEGDREKALEAGCNDYLTKPLKIEVIRKMINKYFSGLFNASFTR